MNDDFRLLRSTITKSGWLSRLPPDMQEAVLPRIILRRYPPKTNVYLVGDPPGGVYGIVSGSIAVVLPPMDRPQTVAHLAVPGSWFGEGGFLTGEPRRIGLRTASESLLANLPLADMEVLAGKDRRFERSFAGIAMLNIDLAIRTVVDLLEPSASRRVGAVVQRACGGHSGYRLHLTQEGIGLMANTSRRQTLAALRELISAGIIRQHYGTIEVIDAVSLKHRLDRG